MYPPLTLVPLAMARFTSAKGGYSEVSLRLRLKSASQNETMGSDPVVSFFRILLRYKISGVAAGDYSAVSLSTSKGLISKSCRRHGDVRNTLCVQARRA